MMECWGCRSVESLIGRVNGVVELNAGMVEFFQMVTSSSSGLFEFSER